MKRRKAVPRRRGPFVHPIDERFWEKVSKKGVISPFCPNDGPCWRWLGYKTKWGHGIFRYDDTTIGAHRVAWKLTFGVWPELFVLHRCGNAWCVNPRHLYEGTDADNARDRKIHGVEPDRRGEKNGHSKLTIDDVREIRRLKIEGFSQRAIADKFGVTQTHISYILRRKNWSHAS